MSSAGRTVQGKSRGLRWLRLTRVGQPHAQEAPGKVAPEVPLPHRQAHQPVAEDACGAARTARGAWGQGRGCSPLLAEMPEASRGSNKDTKSPQSLFERGHTLSHAQLRPSAAALPAAWQ